MAFRSDIKRKDDADGYAIAEKGAGGKLNTKQAGPGAGLLGRMRMRKLDRIPALDPTFHFSTFRFIF